MKPHPPASFVSSFPIGRGHRTPATLLAIDERAKFLRMAARHYCAGMSDRQAAEMLRSKLLRFRATAWRRDASENLCPPRLRGTIGEFCWMVLKVRDHVPSAGTIAATLAKGR